MKKFMRNRKTQRKIVSLALLLSLLLSDISGSGLTIKAEAASQKEGIMATQDETETKEITEYGVVVDYPDKGDEIYDNLEDYPTGLLDAEDEEISDENTVSTVEELREELLKDGSASFYEGENGVSTASTTYPIAVDNSTNENAKYLPNIINQRGGSCVCASFVYTLGTYTINKARDLDSSKPENQLSPYFMYNLIRTGSSTGNGCYNSFAARYMEEIGSPTLDLIPDTYANFYNNLYSLYPQEEIWADAGSNQITNYIKLTDISHVGTPITSATDSDLDLIKEAISAGKLIGMGTRFRTFNYSTIPSASKSHGGENVVDRCDRYVGTSTSRDYGNHAMVIVGYDDEIWTDINRDGVAQTGEYGAFKIVNSHGDDYMDDGFVWVAYDAINKVSSVLTSDDETRINAAVDAGTLSCGKVSSEDRMEFFKYNEMYTFTAAKEEDTTAGAFLVLNLDNANSYSLRVIITAKDKSTGEAAGSYTFIAPYTWRRNYSYSGKTSTTTDTISIDLNNVISDKNLNTLLGNYEYSVTVKGRDSSANYVINDISIKKDGKCYAYVSESALENNNTITGTNSQSFDLITKDLTGKEVIAEPASGRVSEGEEVTFTAECLADENLEYQFVLKYDLKEQVVRDYSKDPTYTWTSKHSYYPTEMIVNFKNTVTGEIVTKSINYDVNKKLYFTGISSIPETMKVGESTPEILISGDGGTGTLTRIIEIEYEDNGKTVFYTGPQKRDLYWTPEKAGNYTIYLSLEDENGIRITKEKKCTVTRDANVATVYYANSNWTNAYIHYKVGDGEWTTVPGVQMSKSSEQSGYTWKYEIDLDDSETATVCFNNGSGSWDSKNAANYTVYAGATGIKNETINPLPTITPTVEPTATPTITTTVEPTATPTVAPTATPTAAPTATPTVAPTVAPTATPTPVENTATVYYANSSWSSAYIHYKVGSGEWTTVPGVQMTQDNSVDGYTWKYEIDLGNSDNATICFNNGSGSWDSKNGSNYTVSAGATGIKNQTMEDIEVGLTVKLSTDKEVGGTYDQVVLSAGATGGAEPYSYNFTITKNGSTQSIAMGSKSQYTWYNISSSGSYDLGVTVTDAEGNTAKDTISGYVVEGMKWDSFTANVLSPQKTGTEITLSGVFKNHQSSQYNYYSYEVVKNGVTTKLSTNSDDTATWTPTEEGTYVLNAIFHYYTGEKYTTSMEYTIKDGNVVNVYYTNSSWNQAYIHYKTNDGSWTSVPGVKMEDSTSIEGYTWRYIIDLGDIDGATICFNNGNGSWDSKNGANYSVGIGTYGVKNGTVSKIN